MYAYVIVFLTIFGFCNGIAPKVTVENGIIEGHYLKTLNGKEFIAFEGIPYAKPPINDLRFEPPQPKEPWIDVWRAVTKHTCIQYVHNAAGAEYTVTGNEDCLYINLYRPKEDVNNLDVLVYIHGGAFMFNSGSAHKPTRIMDRNVILITLNYRLGPLGFLSLEDKVLPGNNGLKDQNLALRWIKENVHHFGGNSNSITIIGMSAGGASVHLHTLTPLSKGLFNKAISQSGVALNPWVLSENTRKKAHKLGELVGCFNQNSIELVNCLKNRPAQNIVEAAGHFFVYLYNPFTPFGPVVDKWAETPFLPEHPLILMKKTQITDVPIMFTFAECEGLYPVMDFATNTKYIEEINLQWNELIPHILDYYNTAPDDTRNQISEAIRKAYFGDKELSMETYNSLIRAASDRIFIKCINDVIQLYAKALTSDVYTYKFSYLTHAGLASIFTPNVKFNCASHADDTLLILPLTIPDSFTEEDKKISNILADIYITFAKYGYPRLEGIEWKPVAKNANNILNYLHIISADNMRMTTEENLGNAEFWNTLPLQENENLFVNRDEL